MEKHSVASQHVSPEGMGQILDIQRQWSNVTERSPETLTQLMEKGLVAVARGKEKKVVATFYMEPLNPALAPDDKEQIFRYGGLATDGSDEGKRSLVKLMREEINRVRAGGRKIIMKTDNPAIKNFLIKCGALVLNYDECEKKFPEYLALYVAGSAKPKEYYADKEFFVVP